MLSNERFVANAPESVITENRQALEEARVKLEKIENELKSLS
jgi:valyl-tRNA synthetase